MKVYVIKFETKLITLVLHLKHLWKKYLKLKYCLNIIVFQYKMIYELVISSSTPNLYQLHLSDQTQEININLYIPNYAILNSELTI